MPVATRRDCRAALVVVVGPPTHLAPLVVPVQVVKAVTEETAHSSIPIGRAAAVVVLGARAQMPLAPPEALGEREGWPVRSVAQAVGALPTQWRLLPGLCHHLRRR